MATERTLLKMATGVDGALVLTGEIDASTAPGLVARLVDASIRVVDLAAVTFVDSSGLRALVQAHERRADAGTVLTLRRSTPAVRRLFEITGLKGFLDIDD